MAWNLAEIESDLLTSAAVIASRAGLPWAENRLLVVGEWRRKFGK